MSGLVTIGRGALAAGLLAVFTSGVGAAQERATPVEFSGQVAFGPCFGRDQQRWSERVGRSRAAEVGRYCRPRIVEPFSDPRLEGEVFVWQHVDRHMHGPTITYSGFTIRNADGAWEQVPGISVDFSDRSDSTGTYAFHGSGDYDGWLMIAEIGLRQDIWTWRGWIVEGRLPPPPEPPAGVR